MFRWALWQNESDNAPLWDSLQARSVLPRDVEGTKAFWLLLRLPGNINSMHPFQELGSLFRLAKQKKRKVPFFPSNQRQVQNCNCKTRTGSGKKRPGPFGGQRNSMNRCPCQPTPNKARGCICLVSGWFLHVQQNASHLVGTQKCCVNEWKTEKTRKGIIT